MVTLNVGRKLLPLIVRELPPEVSPAAWSNPPLTPVTVGTGSSGMVRVTELAVTVRFAAPTTEVRLPLVSVTEVGPLRLSVMNTLEMVSVVPLVPNDNKQLAADACPPAASSAASTTAKTPAMRKKRGPSIMPRTPVLRPDGVVNGREVHVPERAMLDRSASRDSRDGAREPGCGQR